MIDRSNAPLPQKKLFFNLPDIKELELENGIKLFFVQKEKLPIVFTKVLVSAGSKFDPPDRRGTGYLTSLLIDEGAGEYDSLALNGEFEKLGSVASVTSNHDLLAMTLLSLKENFNRSLELLSKIILKPRFEENDFAREKKKVIDRILQLKDESSFIASSALDKLVFGDSYYAVPEIGYENSVSEISNDNIKNFYRNNITTSNTKLIVVGNLTETEAVDLFDKYLGNWNTTLNSSPSFELPKRNPTNYYFVHKENSAQSELRIGHLARKRNAEDHIQTQIMNTILGGQFSSRINLNLREDKGFTYGASSSFQYYQDAGLFEVSTAVENENTGAAIYEILKELKGIRENISSEEIDLAKSYLIKQFPSRFETYSQVAKNIEQLLIHNLSIDEMNDYTKKIESATNEEICTSAVENIFPDELVVVAVGDRTKISSQLQSLKGKEPVELDLNGNLLN